MSPSIQRVTRGAGWIYGFRWLERLLEFLSVVVLARILLPEDFGLVAVEAQAAGCPVIGFGRGGLLDTVVPLAIETDGSRETAPVEATGVFFDAQTPESLCEAVERFERHEHRFNPCDLRRWAEGFSPARFDREFDAEIALAFGEARKCPTPSSSQAFGRPA